jgi:hypothetical protein
MRQPKCECGKCKYCKKRAEYKHRSSYILRSLKYQKENNAALERLESVDGWALKAEHYLDHYEKRYWESVNDRYSHRTPGTSPMGS